MRLTLKQKSRTHCRLSRGFLLFLCVVLLNSCHEVFDDAGFRADEFVEEVNQERFVELGAEELFKAEVGKEVDVFIG